MIPSSVTAISFDAAGTLIEPYPGVGEVYAEVLREHGYSAEPDDVQKRFRQAFKAVKQEQPGRILDQAAWRDIVHQSIADFAPEASRDAIFEQLWERFAQPECWRILPDVFDVLNILAKRGYRLAVLSNNDERLPGVLEGLGLAGFFERIFLSVQTGFEKPDIRAFRAVERALEVGPSQMLHVGDSECEDGGAVEAGWHFCHVNDQLSLKRLIFPK